MFLDSSSERVLVHQRRAAAYVEFLVESRVLVGLDPNELLQAGEDGGGRQCLVRP